MRVLVRHGHFSFFPRGPEDLARFQIFLGVTLVAVDDYYTFPTLALAERFSIIARPYVNLPALTTCERREPWQVMRENGFVYHLPTGLLVPALTVISVVELAESQYFYMQNSILQPGARLITGQQILGYDAHYDFDASQLRILEVSYE